MFTVFNEKQENSLIKLFLKHQECSYYSEETRRYQTFSYWRVDKKNLRTDKSLSLIFLQIKICSQFSMRSRKIENIVYFDILVSGAESNYSFDEFSSQKPITILRVKLPNCCCHFSQAIFQLTLWTFFCLWVKLLRFFSRWKVLNANDAVDFNCSFNSN